MQGAQRAPRRACEWRRPAGPARSWDSSPKEAGTLNPGKPERACRSTISRIVRRSALPRAWGLPGRRYLPPAFFLHPHPLPAAAFCLHPHDFAAAVLQLHCVPSGHPHLPAAWAAFAQFPGQVSLHLPQEHGLPALQCLHAHGFASTFLQAHWPFVWLALPLFCAQPNGAVDRATAQMTPSSSLVVEPNQVILMSISPRIEDSLASPTKE
jgi:hypothetical protein